MNEPFIFAVGPCYTCKQPFAFDVDRVASVPIDPTNGMPPDMGGDPTRAVRQPLCNRCIPVLNAARMVRGRGLALIPLNPPLPGEIDR